MKKEKYYMDIDDIREWFQIADDDLYSAKALNELVRKPYEIICYHRAQAIEKYLKGYLAYKEATFQKTHNLRYLVDLCIEFDNEFQNATTLCDYINRFANEIRYPDRVEVKIEDVNYSLSAVEKLKNIEPLKKLREIIENPDEIDKN